MKATTSGMSVLGLGCILAIGGLGCQHSSEPPGTMTAGQQMERRSEALKAKAEMTQKGERLVVDGNAMIAKGRVLSEQGQTIDGEKMKIEGEAKVREGTMYIRKANEMQLPPAPAAADPSTMPSNLMNERSTPSTRPSNDMPM